MLGSKIRELRKEAKYTQEDLARLLRNNYGLGTDRAMVSKWETGFQEPQVHTLKCIANLFGVTIDELNGETVINSPSLSLNNVDFAVIGDIAAGFDKIAVEEWTGDSISIPKDFLKGHSQDEFFVLRVTGDSMYPDYKNGDKLLIFKQQAVDYSGQVAAVIYGNEYGTLKKVEYRKDSIHLVPINPQYTSEIINGADMDCVHILGVPKLLIRDIDD
ncbi:MAG: helix-turn-helix domain-containing protein [Anaerotruncus sp.]|nr:helix-turn-helix domain-containing protein [Anaerotruncus sp.]